VARDVHQGQPTWNVKKRGTLRAESEYVGRKMEKENKN